MQKFKLLPLLLALCLLLTACAKSDASVDTGSTDTQTTATEVATTVFTANSTTATTTTQTSETQTMPMTTTTVSTIKSTTTTVSTIKVTTTAPPVDKSMVTTIPTTTLPTHPPYTLHKDHLDGWEVIVDGKQVTVSLIEDETGWTYVSLVPLLDSLESVDRIVWENSVQATIYRTPVSDSEFCAGEKFSLDIQRGELYQLIPLRDNWNILQILVAGTTSHNVNGYIVHGNEIFVDTHVLQMVGMSFDFRHEFLWETQRLEIMTRAK